MSGETKPKQNARDNPWYMLAIFHGEPATSEIAAKNRVTWNRWAAPKMSNEHQASLLEMGQYTLEELTPLPEEELRSIESQLGIDREDFTDFSDTEFERPFVARGFIFPSDTSFHGAIFHGYTDFSSATMSHASFSGAAFCGEAFFDGATFSGDALFTDAIFSGFADFRRAKFNRTAWFGGATFSGSGTSNPFNVNRLDLFTSMNVTIGCASFSSATFGGDANFALATFGGLTFFNGATFSGDANFAHVTFSDTAFNGAIFSSSAAFESATFSGFAEFENAEMLRSAYFDKARFSVPPRCFNAKLHEGTTWHGVKWPETPANVDQARAFADAYARLKQEMDKLKKHSDELDFFALEQQCQQVVDGPWKGAPIAIYGFVSDYGRSYARPLLLLVQTVLVGAVPLLLAPSRIGNSEFFRQRSAAEAIGISFANTFSILGRPIIEADVLLGLPNWLKAVATLQTILGVVLLFLFGLGIRNRFRMK
jgi:uncharacterized protein YjbI with pentapeptide repeats